MNTGAAFGGLPGAFVAGLSDRADVVDQSGEIECLDLKLTPLGAYTLLGVPMSGLTNGVTDLADVLGPDAARLTERLANTADRAAPVRRARRVPAGSRGRRPGTGARGGVGVAAAAGHARGRAGGRRWPTEVGWSRRHLVTRFHEQVGLPPKTAARVVRFSSLLRRIEDAGAWQWSRIAAECGYYDQAHMNRDFREFAGTTPTDYLARRVTSVQYAWVSAD